MIGVLFKTLIISTIALSCSTAKDPRSYILKKDDKRKERNIDQQFLIASNTKMFIGFAILKLEEDKKLQTSDLLIDFIPELKESKFYHSWKKVTLDSLLNHYAHIPNYYSSEHFKKNAFQSKVETEDIINVLIKSDYKTLPDNKFSYCNTCYILLGEVIKRTSKKTVNEYLKEIFFIPFGMEVTRIDSKADIFKNNPQKELHVNETFTDGNLISSPRDMRIWFQAIITKRIFKNFETFDKLYNSRFDNNYSYGVFVTRSDGDTVLSHSGSWLNFHSMFKLNITKSNFYFFATDSEERKKFKAKVREVEL